MADQAWDDFLDATKAGSEEVETPEEVEDEALNPSEEDPNKKPATSTEDEELDDPANPPAPDANPKPGEEEEEEDPAKPTPADPATPPAEDEYKPRLTQFFDKDGKLSTEKIEKGYIETSKEAVRLAQELKEQKEGNREILAKIANDPELAKRFFTPDEIQQIEKAGGVPDPKAAQDADPIRSHFEAQLLKTQREEYDSFVEANPSAIDPARAQTISEFIPLYRDMYRKDNNGMLPSMKDTLTAVYRLKGWELAEDVASKNEVEERARKAQEEAEALKQASRKDAAATQTPARSKKAPAQPQFSKEAIAMANKLGYTVEDLKKSVKK
jgi:hypothetical protein